MDARKVAEAAARNSYGKLLSYLASYSRDLGTAEDALSDAYARALQDWPQTGVPNNPEAWLTTVARNRTSVQDWDYRLIEEAEKIAEKDHGSISVGSRYSIGAYPTANPRRQHMEGHPDRIAFLLVMARSPPD